MNRHEDDEGHSTGQSSPSSRLGARILPHNIVIYIEALTGQLYELRCSPLENIWSIKGRLQRLEGIPISQQHMIWSGEELKDSSIIHEVGIKNSSKLRLVVSMRGGPVNTRIIDEDIEEGEIAVVVVKEGEKVSVFRVPSSVSPSSSAISTANLHTASLSSHQVTSKGETSSKFASAFSDRQRHIDNKKTYQTMEMIRNKLNQKKRSQLPPLPTRVKEPLAEVRRPAGDRESLFPSIAPNEYKVPVPNVHSAFLKRYGLQPAQKNSKNLEPVPPLNPPAPKKAQRPRCAKCGKRLALTEQYECRCGLKYCTRHRYAEEHSCQFDYQKEQQHKLRQTNPNSLQTPKLPKI